MENTVEYILNKLKESNVEYCEVRHEEVENDSFVLKNSNPELSGCGSESGIGIRYTINGSLGFISLNDFDKKKIDEILNKSIRLTKNCKKLTDYTNFGEGQINIDKYKVKEKIKLDSITPDVSLEVLKSLDNDIKKDAQSRFLSLNKSMSKKLFMNNDGCKIYSEIPRVGIMYLLTLIEGTKSLQRYAYVGASGGWESLENIQLNQKLKEEVSALKKALEFGKKIKEDKMDVVCGPEVTGIAVHESVGHPYEADRIFGRESAQAGESFINPSYIGKQIGNEMVNVVDDPTIENGFGYYLYDDEGIKARRKFLMKDGKVNEFLHNRETAAAMKIKSNGSSRASDYDKEAIVRMSNTFMLPGKFDEKEKIEDVKKGVYIKNFMEWNIDDRRWQQKYVGSEAYMIEEGEITKPVLNPILEITTPALYSSIDAVGKKVQHFAGQCGKGEPMQGIPVWMGGPMIRLKNIHIK